MDRHGLLHNEALDFFWNNRNRCEIYFEDFKDEALDLIATFYAATNINPDNIGGGFETRKNYYRNLETSRYYSPQGLIFSSIKAQELSDELFQNSICKL